ncbi:hypothetical protein GpartN1_g2933.t1 [Galdieria partita]|uniref:UDENN domain-containing protein n=1 Tax=Galdieria partita TaxID=83374 RepID=A0A9C7PX36_9RHOD|nr:hypothetical protein GpartN1_g2933.t1 [Galdieria partita]
MFPLLGLVWVEFDVENGPCVRETFYPSCEDTSSFERRDVFSTSAKDFIAFHAMPDSTSVSSEVSQMEDSLFFFRFPCSLLLETELAGQFWNSNRPCQSKFCFQTVEPVGHSLFRVTASESARRGYSQHAIVAVCTTSLSTCFVRPLLYLVASRLFQYGRLQKSEIEQELGYLKLQWLEILAEVEGKDGTGTLVKKLTFLNSSLLLRGDYVLCPCGSIRHWCIHAVEVTDEEPNLYNSMKTRDFPITSLVKPNCSVPFFHEFDLYICFSENLGYLWTLWELMMLGESILVVSSTPARACSAVGCLLSLLVPLLPITVDWQSYFVIQDLDESKDKEYQHYSLIGITSAFLCRQFEQARNVLFIGQPVDRHSEMYPSLYLKTKYCPKFRKNKRFLKALQYSSQRLATCVILREYFREMTLTILRMFHSFFVPLNAQEMKPDVTSHDEDDVVKILMQSPPKFRSLDKATFPSDDDIEVSSVMSLLSSKRDALANKFLLDKKHLFYPSLSDRLSENDENVSSEGEEDDSDADDESSELSRNLDALQLSGKVHHVRTRFGSDDHVKKGIRHKLKEASRHRKLSKRKVIVRHFVKDFIHGPVFEEWFSKRRLLAEHRWFVRYKQCITNDLSKLEKWDRIWQLPSRWRSQMETHINYVRQMGESELECCLMNSFTQLEMAVKNSKQS